MSMPLLLLLFFATFPPVPYQGQAVIGSGVGRTELSTSLGKLADRLITEHGLGLVSSSIAGIYVIFKLFFQGLQDFLLGLCK